MKLLELVNTYVTFKRSLGMRFTTQPRVLRRFSRVLGDIEVCEVTPEAVRAFLDGDRSVTNTWFLNYRLLRGLFSVCHQPWLHQALAAARLYAFSFATLPAAHLFRPTSSPLCWVLLAS